MLCGLGEGHNNEKIETSETVSLRWKVLCAILHASTVACVWLVDFHDLYASVGSHAALGVALDATNVLTTLGDEPFSLTENTSLRLWVVKANCST